VTTDTRERGDSGGGAILDELDLDAALEGAADLGLDLEAVMQADPEQEQGDRPGSFDFNRPHSISRRFSQNLQNIAELFSRGATVNLTSMLRANVVVDFQGTSLRTCAEYRKSLPRATCLAALTMRPLNGQSLLNLDLSLCFVLLKKLMGGRPDSEEKVRPFTEIERGIFTHFVGRLAEMLRLAAAKLVDLQPEIVALENNPEYVAGIPGGETMAVLRFRVRLEAVEGVLDLAFPLTAFTPIRDIVDPEEHLELRSPQEREQDQRQIMDLVQGTSSELIVLLGERSLPLDQVLDLREGDLLHLPQPVSAPLTVYIEDQAVFLAEAGRINQNRAVKLVRKLEKE
jgi:flagellar motor switch protein FliM